MFTGDLKDRVELHELVASYGDLVSAKELEEWTQLWTEDCHWEHPRFGVNDGRDAVTQVCSGAFDNLPFIHFTSALGSLRVEGESATGRVWVTEVATTLAGSTSSVSGVYYDEYSRVGGGWKFRSRKYEYRYRAKFDPLPLM